MNDLIKQDQNRLKLFKRYGYDIPKARNYIIKKAGLVKGGKMLEVGTGRGHLAVKLAQNGFKFISIDLDKRRQRVAKIHLNAIKRAKWATLKNMNAERLKYKDGYFTQVISVNFIHHAKNPIKCLKEMVRVTKNKLVIADINKRGERIMEKVHGLDGHRHEKSKMSLREAETFLRRTGLSVKVYKDTCQTVLIATKGEIK